MNNTENIPPESNLIRGVRFTFYPLICFIGILGNGIVCLFFVRNKRWRMSAAYYFVLNLSISDILVLIMFLPFDLLYIEHYKWIWPFGKFMCKFMNTIGYVSVTVSGTTLIAISYDRNRSIVAPLRPAIITPTGAIIINILIWIYSTLTLLPFVFALRIFPDGQCMTDLSIFPSSFSLELIYLVLVFIPEFGLPLTAISIAYIQIALYLKQYQRNLATNDMRPMAAYRARQNTKTLRILSWLIVVYVVCILPHQLVILLIVFNKEYLSSPVVRDVHEFTRLLTTANSCINPLCYGTLSKPFRDKVLSMWRCKNKVHPLRNKAVDPIKLFVVSNNPLGINNS